MQNAAEDRSLLVRRMRSDARLALMQYRAARKNMSLDTRAQLRRSRAEIAAAVGSIRYERRRMIDRVAKSVPGQHELVVPQVWSDPPGLLPVIESTLETVEQNVVRIIHAHPEGLTLPEIGNAMGVDWRSLVSVMHGMADAGTIERIEDLIYPGWK